MNIVDREGRLFGRLNLVDAILLCLAVGLIPLGYAAYVLFRTPAATLASVEPKTLTAGPEIRVRVRGENLRPYMRLSLNDVQGRNFLFADTTTAEADFEGIPAGVYDVVLYDISQERGRLPRALTVAGAIVPTTQMVVVGMLSNLTADTAPRIVKGMALDGLGTVLDVGRPAPAVARIDTGAGTTDFPAPSGLQVPVSVQITCEVQGAQGPPRCVTAGKEIRLNQTVTLHTAIGALPLLIDQMRSAGPLEPVRVRVRFTGDPGALAHVAVGDRDLGRWANELVSGGRVVSVMAVHRTSDQEATRDADLVVPAQAGSTTWQYGGDTLRIGGALALRTPLYELTGQVIDLSPPPSAAR